MPRLVSERIKKLREEIAEISEANRTQMHRRDGGATADQERRRQRLQEILDELMTLTDWKKTYIHEATINPDTLKVKDGPFGTTLSSSITTFCDSSPQC